MNCKGCGAEIRWVISENGKRMPLDAKPEKRFVILVDSYHEVVRLEDTYVSHFATCPKAKEFRK